MSKSKILTCIGATVIACANGTTASAQSVLDHQRVVLEPASDNECEPTLSLFGRKGGCETIEPESCAQGLVQTESGEPMPETRVDLVEGDETLATTTTDSDGFFSLPCVDTDGITSLHIATRGQEVFVEELLWDGDEVSTLIEVEPVQPGFQIHDLGNYQSLSVQWDIGDDDLFQAVADGELRDGFVGTEQVAWLLRHELGLSESQQTAHWWFYVPGTGKLVVDTDGLELAVHSVEGEAIASAFVSEADPAEGLTTVYFEAPIDGAVVLETRRRDDRVLDSVALGIDFDAATFASQSFVTASVSSPWLDLDSGASLDTVFGMSPFEAATFSNTLYGLPAGEPTAFLEYFLQAELFNMNCGAPLFDISGGLAPTTTVAGKQKSSITGPSSAPGFAQHNVNICGLSVFIRSMKTTFPGALKADIETNTAYWDKIAGLIGHSNKFGMRGAAIDLALMDNFTEKTSTEDGKRYCLSSISNTDIQNLAYYAEDCDLKMLVYDRLFAHWADVDNVDVPGDQLGLMDYNRYDDVGYKRDPWNWPFNEEEVDFMGSGGTMRSHFKGANYLAGDDRWEIVDFYAVCECDKKVTKNIWGTVKTEWVSPTKTKSGKTLKP